MCMNKTMNEISENPIKPIVIDTVSDSVEKEAFSGFLKNVQKLSGNVDTKTVAGGKLPIGVLTALGDFLARDVIRTISKAESVDSHRIESFRVNTPLAAVIAAFMNASTVEECFEMNMAASPKHTNWCKDAFRDIDEFKKMKRNIRNLSPTHTSSRFASYTMADLLAIGDTATSILSHCISNDSISVKINVDMWAVVDTYSDENPNKKHQSMSVNLRTAFETLIGY